MYLNRLNVLFNIQGSKFPGAYFGSSDNILKIKEDLTLIKDEDSTETA